MQKQVQFKVIGMQRDLSASAFNPKYAYEIKNMRVMPTDDNTLMNLTNEKGNKDSKVDISLEDLSSLAYDDGRLILFDNKDSIAINPGTIEGIPIGQAVLKDKLIVFTTGIEDIIYKIWFNDNARLVGEILYRGHLNFDSRHPIEAMCFYENEDIQKVYWTDGLNQPRMINIAASIEVKSNWNNDSFNFVNVLELKENVTIQKDEVAQGSFPAGVIQYAFTYFNKYGQESNIFYTSPLYYTSFSDRGGSPEDKVSNSFTIHIENTDSHFDYLRVYSIMRTSINATPEVKRVVDLSVSNHYNKFIYGNYETKGDSNSIIAYNFITHKYEHLNDIEPFSYTEEFTYWRINKEKYSSITLDTGEYISVGNDDYINVVITKTNDIIISTNTGSFVVNNILTDNIIINYVDNGQQGDLIDPTELLYKGGEEVIFGTMTQKDNTLFLGDIKLNRKLIDKETRELLKFNKIVNKIKTIKSDINPLGYYPYKNSLDKSSFDIKSFKYLEWYRLGVQFQYKTGKWSEPIFLKDIQNTQHIKANYSTKADNIEIPCFEYQLNNAYGAINALVSKGYIKARPVVVFPSLQDRECICQGILCPTVYNVRDRYSNSPFVQSSWFTRPFLPYDISKSQGGLLIKNWEDRQDSNIKVSLNSRAGVLYSGSKLVLDSRISVNTLNSGEIAEFRHNKPIPNNNKRNAEIQCLANVPSSPLVSIKENENGSSNWVDNHSEYFFVDQSIVTLHSPDIEFDTNIQTLDTSNLKLRIVGLVPLTSFVGDIDIQTSTPPHFIVDKDGKETNTLAEGFVKRTISAENISRFGSRGLMSGAFWKDEISDLVNGKGNTEGKSTGFLIYPFQRHGSLNNQKSSEGTAKRAELKRKKISNLKYSYNSYYLNSNNIWNAEIKGNSKYPGISGAKVFNSNENSLIRIPSPKYSNLPDINYYGNIDKVVNITRKEDNVKGYPIVTTGEFSGSFFNEPTPLDPNITNSAFSTDPVRVKYKSTPHAVIAFNYCKVEDGTFREFVLPTFLDGDITGSPDDSTWFVNDSTSSHSSELKYFWERNKVSGGAFATAIRENFSKVNNSLNGYGPEYGFLWLGELYNDNVANRFGGQTEEAFENNLWVPCGKAITLIDNNGNPVSNAGILFEEGDTYYQRYDHIKTYPYTLEDENAITDIVSFMCETRVNIDGRYDRNRGQTNNFAITPENFNKINEVYSQYNNFFNYRALNINKFNLDNFHNSITWTKTKTAGELVDTWTNITLASTLDLDGDKGKVRALRRFNNNILAFQDTGISHILYNENVQIASTEGVPIEIANSGKVQGKRYISDHIGCTNKWSICETSNGIYFIDDVTKGIYLFNGNVSNISDKLGFHSWINNTSNLNIWNPKDFSNIITYYDKVNGDVFFINDKECLAFSEPLGQFSSFYSYEKTPYFVNLKDRGIAIHKDDSDASNLYKLWLHNEGDYNMYFNKYQPFYTTVIANPDMPNDKIFNTLEFRADTWNNEELVNKTFDTLDVWNEYQIGKSNLVNIKDKPSTLKKKFRIWRANIPRDIKHTRDRMRNPWLYLKLSKNTPDTLKTTLHDMIVSYFI